MESKIVWLQSISSVHIGSGGSVGVIDLPIVREKVTNWPYLPGSAIKGVFRDACQDGASGALIKEAFGPDTSAGEGELDGAGCLWFADARLLCFPVRSLHGTFAWLTCPYALLRLSRDRKAVGLPPLAGVPTAIDDDKVLLASHSVVADNEHVYLEDIDLSLSKESASSVADSLAKALFEDGWREEFKQRFGIVSDNMFSYLVETCTEVAAHIRIDDQRKTVQEGALWYEESVPPETIFTMPLTASPRKNGVSGSDLFALMDEPLREPIQVGGKASVGRGLIRACVEGKE